MKTADAGTSAEKMQTRVLNLVFTFIIDKDMEKKPLLPSIFLCKTHVNEYLRIMKISLFLLFTCVFQMLAVRTEAQNAKISLSAETISVGQLISEIEKQTDYLVVFSNREVDTNRMVNIHNRSGKVLEYLNEAFGKTDVQFEFENDYIVLTKRATLEKTTEQQQTKKVYGKVVDESGEPIIGANVYDKEKKAGTVTDVDGNFTLDCDPGVKLLFSYIGYLPVELVSTSDAMTVVLKENQKELDEVVVIGYGTAKRKDFTGSVSSLKMEDSPVSLMPNMNAAEALKGTVSGLNIGATTSSGNEPTIQVRGQNSIKGNNAPLIVLDGVVFMGNLSDINPNDIASYDVLKDAVSAAVYGSRAANGIIAITTKRGRSEKPVVTLNASLAFKAWQRKPEPLKAADWVNLVNAANSYEPGTTSWLKPQEVANMEAGREIDWMDEISQTGLVQNYQLAVSGAKEKLNYYVSASYDDNKGVVIGDQFDRISVLGKINTDITDWLQIGVDASYSKRNYTKVTADIHRAAVISPYGVKYRDEENNLEKYPSEQGGSYVNPLWGVNDGLVDGKDVRDNFRISSFALVSIPWVKGLTYRFNMQNTLDNRQDGMFYHEGYYVGEGAVTNTDRYAQATIERYLTQANGYDTEYRTRSYLIDNILNYKKDFGKHSLDITAVATRDRANYDVKKMTGSDFAANGNTTLGINGLHKATVQKIVMQGKDDDVNDIGYKRVNIGYLGRVNYSFDSKYFLTGSFRRDGASVFGLNRKWGNFWAAGAAWRISGENFMEDITALNNLKLKLSWGQNGNQGVSPYGTLAKVINGSTGGIRYEFSDSNSKIYYGLGQQNLGNSNLGWEQTEKWNVGFESAWLNNRLFADMDVYFSKTVDEIYTPTIPSMTGFTKITSSLGEVQNKGVELTLRSVNIQNKDWFWTTTVTYWLNRNKLVRLDGQDLNNDGIEDDKIADGMFIGQPLESIYGYVWDGIIQPGDEKYKSMPGASTIDGYPKYKDLNNDGEITPEDRTILGYPQENFKLNMSNLVTYKNFELYVMIAGVFGGGKYYQKSNPLAYQSTTGDGFNANMTYRPYYTAERPSSLYPAAYFKGDSRFQGLQSRTFVRVQNISLSYNFDKALLKGAFINNLKVFFTANNPFLLTKWDGGDPEAGIKVLSNDSPVTSSYSLGVKVDF